MVSPGSGARLSRVAVRVLGAALLGALLIGAFVGLACVRIVAGGEAELARSTQALRDKDPDAAVLHARRAASWSLPRAPHVAKARERLRALALAAEAKKRLDLAFLAWRALRASEIEARSWSSGRTPDRDEAELAIARLAAASERPMADRTLPADGVERWHAETLARDTLPSPPWSALLVVSALAWCASALAFGSRLRALSAAKGLTSLAGLALVLTASAAAWIVAMLRA